MFYEIEKGPHFLTFYNTNRAEVIHGCSKIYTKFISERVSLKSIQQENFTHITDDAKIYHPYGSPDKFRTNFGHFHIRFPAPEVEIEYCIDLLERLGFEVQANITNLEDPDMKYPPPKVGEIYLDYIERLRANVTDPSTF